MSARDLPQPGPNVLLLAEAPMLAGIGSGQYASISQDRPLKVIGGN
jgi:hypothetical protein